MTDTYLCSILGFPDGSVVEKLPANAGDADSILGLGRSPGEVNAWEIPWTEEPVRLQSRGHKKVGSHLVTK